MEPTELEIIERLTDVPASEVKLADDGFWSRGYIIDDGRIVFKFKKSPEVSYQTEIKMLELVNALNLGINTQRVGWISSEDEYLGVYGVIGESLENVEEVDYAEIGRQLALALRKLHQAQVDNSERITLEEEIAAWQQRYQESQTEFARYFDEAERRQCDELMLRQIPEQLRALGEKLVFSHGDLGDGNILVDQAGRVGVIDFSGMCYLDEAADFMDVSSDELRVRMLEEYGADERLQEKVRLRVLVRPLFVFGDYARRNDAEKVEQLAAKIRHLITTTVL